MVERKPRVRYVPIPGADIEQPDNSRAILIQVRALGKDRRRRLQPLTKGGRELPPNKHLAKQPRRSVVVVGYKLALGDEVGIPYEKVAQRGVFCQEEDLPGFQREGVVFDGDTRQLIDGARKRRTTRAHLKFPLRKGAVLGTPKIPPVVETGPGAVPGFRMPSKLEASRHLPPKLKHK